MAAIRGLKAELGNRQRSHYDFDALSAAATGLAHLALSATAWLYEKVRSHPASLAVVADGSDIKAALEGQDTRPFYGPPTPFDEGVIRPAAQSDEVIDLRSFRYRFTKMEAEELLLNDAAAQNRPVIDAHLPDEAV
jgi:hypothetical protein